MIYSRSGLAKMYPDEDYRRSKPRESLWLWDADQYVMLMDITYTLAEQ